MTIKLLNSEIPGLTSGHANSPNQLLIFDQWFKLWATRDGQIESFGSKERLEVKQIEVVVIHKVGEKLVAKAMEGGHDPQSQVPLTIGGPIYIPEGQGRKTVSMYCTPALSIQYKMNLSAHSSQPVQ